MSSAPHDDTASFDSFSTTTSLDAMEAAEIKANISKKPSSIPTTAFGVNVFYNNNSGNRVFLGTVNDKSKFTHFSLVAREQLTKDNKAASETSNASKDRSVTLGRIDHAAGLLVLKYINTNTIHNTEPLTHELLAIDSTFAFCCKVHQAFNAFRILRQLCGDDFRDRLCFEIHQLPIVIFADFQLVYETVPFDAGLMNVMQNKVAYHTLRGWITEHELACIWEYVGKCDAVKGRNYVERIEELFQKLQADAAARGQVFKSGYCAEGATPPAQQGAGGAAVVVPLRPRNMTVVAAEKASVTLTSAAAHGGGTHNNSVQTNQPEDSEPAFIRPSTAGPPLDLSSPLKATPTKLISKTRTTSTPIPKLTLKTGNPTVSKIDDKIDWLFTETNTPKKPFGNVGGAIDAIKAAPGLVKGKGKAKVAVQETKEQKQGEDKGDGKEDGKVSGKGKGKENITSTETPPAASPSTPGKMSWTHLLGGS
ncbi:hypothetical protein Q7P35_006626 [Cladosporium inversicolor]